MSRIAGETTTVTADVVVIGGGLHGCSAALHLALAGMSVIVLEKDYVGRHASGVNAGGVRRLGRALPEIPLSVASAQMWSEISELVGDDCGFEASLQIKVAETEADLATLENRSNDLKTRGYCHEKLVDRETVRELLPAVSPHCVGAMVVEGDGHANPFRTVRSFSRRAERLGATVIEDTRVLRIDRKNGCWHLNADRMQIETPNLVNTAGAWGGRIAAMLGETIPVHARAPMLMITARMPPFVTPVVGAQGRKLSFKQFANGTVLIGGGHEGQANLDTNAALLDPAGLAANARSALALFPIMKKARIVRQWAGIEGMMPDGIPVIGPSQAEGACHGFGFSAHGFQLGPVGGKILADLVLHGETGLEIEAFRPNRFNDCSA